MEPHSLPFEKKSETLLGHNHTTQSQAAQMQGVTETLEMIRCSSLGDALASKAKELMASGKAQGLPFLQLVQEAERALFAEQSRSWRAFDQMQTDSHIIMTEEP